MSTSITLPPGLDFVPRKEWGAHPGQDMKLMRNPVTHVRLTYTGGKSCDDKESCIRRVKEIQEHHMCYHELEDIAFNFMVGRDGRIYEGRGWHQEADRIDKYEHMREVGIDIGFIGKYKKNHTPIACTKSAEDFIQYGVDAGLIHRYYMLIKYEDVIKEDYNNW